MTNTTDTNTTPAAAPATTAAVLARLQKGRTPAPARKAAKAKAAKPAKAKGKAAKRAAQDGPRYVVIKGVKHDISHYQKATSASGNASLDSGDQLARELRGLDLDAVYERASKALIVTVRALKDQYRALNPGMQRMNLGNRMRAAAKRAEAKRLAGGKAA